jgi:hypothetical protein
MATHNTKSDAANTAVRAFLTSVGEQYWGKPFNTATGESKKIWEDIKDNVFKGECCYCGLKKEKLNIEHLIMFNRSEFGLHHPGNVVPCCNECNKRSRDANGRYCSWEEHLKIICKMGGEIDKFNERKNLILHHMTISKYKYPNFTKEEKNAIRVIAEAIYEGVKTKLDESLKLYFELVKSFVKNS